MGEIQTASEKTRRQIREDAAALGHDLAPFQEVDDDPSRPTMVARCRTCGADYRVWISHSGMLCFQGQGFHCGQQLPEPHVGRIPDSQP